MDRLQQLVEGKQPDLLIQAQLDILSEALSMISAHMQGRDHKDVALELRDLMAGHYLRLAATSAAGGKLDLPPPGWKPANEE